MDPFQPFRRTTTVTFHRCANRFAILSPDSDTKMRTKCARFVERLTVAGFEVTKNDVTGLHDVAYHRFWEPDKEYGYTMGAVLSASDASVHTYPELDFGSTYELELNLCYLRESVVSEHDSHVNATIAIFKGWLQADDDDVEVEVSRARYFKPIAVAA